LIRRESLENPIAHHQSLARPQHAKKTETALQLRKSG